ncbi:uncharacterized protein LOC107492544 isoform X1 [Arachis duranensis]|uniref:Uncharacterized protein LOC107492544 isoform X1 n=1 Tax=Arachis duranensis TaxID=130453 RepID=A0A9C6T016_ARADU|nr:uncharacterized protein LOC107492544 isoform X1 [Arachis duranensis]
MLPSVNSSSLLLPIAVSITEPLFLPLTLSRIRFALLIFLARTQKGQRCKTHLRVPIFAAVPLRPCCIALSVAERNKDQAHQNGVIFLVFQRLCFVGNAENIMKEAGPVSMTFDIPMYHALRLQARDLISKITEERNSIIDQNKKPQQELDPRAKNIEDVLMLSGDHRLYRMNYIDLIQVYRESKADLCIDCKRRCGWKVGFFVGDTINMFM